MRLSFQQSAHASNSFQDYDLWELVSSNDIQNTLESAYLEAYAFSILSGSLNLELVIMKRMPSPKLSPRHNPISKINTNLNNNPYPIPNPNPSPYTISYPNPCHISIISHNRTLILTVILTLTPAQAQTQALALAQTLTLTLHQS
ncbi:hypothetical protein PoB_005719200 [Plakobranchus ocellatus]|uniref:Uncharacterized protein n=1 Tax=Plakobranchus ocellatus TaxID=259542 RepID=A0AAV4CGF4_9GAST|nr:hypothetical protein PoB_005719200 [Plakobranchus ocellatus]